MASVEYKEYMKGVVHHSGNFAGKARYIHAEEVHNMTAPDMIVPIVLNLCPGVQSVVDFGCGLGTWLRAFREQGVKEILGLEGEWCNRTLLFKNIDEAEFNL